MLEMDKELSNFAENLSYSLKSDGDADFLINMLKDKLQHYKKLNTQNDKFISKIKVNPDSLNTQCKDILHSFALLQEHSGVKSLETCDIGITFLDVAESRNKCKNRLDKLETYQAELSESIDDISKEIERLEKEISLASSTFNLSGQSNVEVNSIKMLIKSYQEKIMQYINKYPWISEPQYNSLSIQEEIKQLYMLREKMEKIQSEKEIFYGLKPDLYAAKSQLAQAKLEYETMYKSYHEALK